MILISALIFSGYHGDGGGGVRSVAFSHFFLVGEVLHFFSPRSASDVFVAFYCLFVGCVIVFTGAVTRG